MTTPHEIAPQILRETRSFPRDPAITLTLLRAASLAEETKRGTPGQKRAANPHAEKGANEQRFTRSRGMHSSPKAPRAIARRPRVEHLETITTASRRWLAEKIEPRRRPKTATNYALAMRALVELIGDVPLDDLTGAQVRLALDSMTDGKRSAYYSAWSSCLHYHGRGDILAGIERPKSRRRRAVLDERSLPHWIAALGLAIRHRWAWRSTIDGCLLGTLVPFRCGEIASLRWSEVDLGSQLAELVDSKTGPRRVPLGKLGASIIATQVRRNDYVFASSRKGDSTSHVTVGAFSGACRRILDRYSEATGYRWHEDMCFHSLRHGWTSHARAIGVDPEDVRQIGGWSTAWQMDRYSHALDRVRTEMDRVQSHLIAGLPMQLSMGVA